MRAVVVAVLLCAFVATAAAGARFHEPTDFILKTTLPHEPGVEAFHFFSRKYKRWHMNETDADGVLRGQTIVDCRAHPEVVQELVDGKCRRITVNGKYMEQHCGIVLDASQPFRFPPRGAEDDPSRPRYDAYMGSCETTSPLAGDNKRGEMWGARVHAEMASLDEDEGLGATTAFTGWCLRKKGDNFVPLSHFLAGVEDEVVTWWDPSPGQVGPNGKVKLPTLGACKINSQ